MSVHRPNPVIAVSSTRRHETIRHRRGAASRKTMIGHEDFSLIASAEGAYSV